MGKQKIKAQADRKQRFAHCSQLHHLHPPFDQQSQGTATQNISSSWGMTAHRSSLWSLSLQHTSALTSHKPLMSASLTPPAWELAWNAAPRATLLLVPHPSQCHIPPSATLLHVPHSSQCHTAWHRPVSQTDTAAGQNWPLRDCPAAWMGVLLHPGSKERLSFHYHCPAVVLSHLMRQAFKRLDNET